MKKTSRTYHSNRYINYKTCKWCGLTKELSEFYDGRWGKKCKVCVRSRAQQYRREHLEQYAEYEKARANLPHRVEARRRYQEEHEEVIARSKKWAENNPDKVSQAKANNRRKRRAAKHASPGSFTAEEFEVLCETYGNECLACGDTGVALEADHVVPLTKGGSDGISNIQPLCGSCNREEFVNIIDYRLAADILTY